MAKAMRPMTQRDNKPDLQTGLSLIELIVVVAIIGILAAVAYPSYQEQVAKSNRAAAQSFLMEVAQRQQQYLLDSRVYASTLAELNLTIPSKVNDFYTINPNTVTPVSATRFMATATPRTGTSQVRDGDLSIDNAGAKTPPAKW